MAIQIRRGTNTEWENNNSNIVVGEPAIATDAERFFVGTASGDYAEFANLDIIAPAYDTSASYVVGDVVNRQGKLYSCNTPCSGTFNASYWDEKSLAEILKDLENEIDYAQYEIGYANGKLITIDNGASEIPVKDLTVDIEAVQDLHGYDHPWAGGAGKNLLPIVDTPTYSGLTIIKNNDGSYNISGKPNSNGSIEFYNDVLNPIRITEPCIFTSEWNPQGNATIIFSTAESSVAIQTSNSDTLNIPIGEYTRFRIYVNSANTYNFTFKPMLRLASVSDATFEPYTNICPISGWDEVNVNVAGKNLFFMENWNLINGYFTLEDGIRKIIANASHYIYYFPCEPNTTYTVSKISGGENIRLGIAYSTEKPAVGSVLDAMYTNNGTKPSGTVVSVTATTSATAKYLAVWAYWVTDEATKSTIQLELGDSRTDFSSFANVYTTDLDGTRYGGTLDVTTGVLTVDIVKYSPTSSENWVWYSNYGYTRAQLLNAPSDMANGIETNEDGEIICNEFPYVALQSATQFGLTLGYANGKAVYINNLSSLGITSLAEFKTWLDENPLEFTYRLATPQVVQLTPTQVRTVLGTNNLWNQMNTNNELAYRISNALN